MVTHVLPLFCWVGLRNSQICHNTLFCTKFWWLYFQSVQIIVLNLFLTVQCFDSKQIIFAQTRRCTAAIPLIQVHDGESNPVSGQVHELQQRTGGYTGTPISYKSICQLVSHSLSENCCHSGVCRLKPSCVHHPDKLCHVHSFIFFHVFCKKISQQDVIMANITLFFTICNTFLILDLGLFFCVSFSV